MTVPTNVRIQREPFDAVAEANKLTRGRSDVGALVTFTGSDGQNPYAGPWSWQIAPR